MTDIPSDILRILDANINRAGEGLRVLEEFSRLSLNDYGITQQLKNLRHKIVITDVDFQKRLLQARNSEEDVGSTMDVPGESNTRTPSELIISNSRRLQESLRVLEELSKTHGLGLDSENYRQSRFEIYTLEKELVGRITRRDKVNKINGLYLIIDTEWLDGRDVKDVAVQAIKGGVNAIQLRCKKAPVREFLAAAEGLKRICSEKGVPLIINDNLEVALVCHADGLHIGQEDLPVNIAKKIIPLDMVLGVSVRTVKEAKDAVEEGADYLGVGAVFATSTKDSAAIGIKELESIVKAVNTPVVAIGGIGKDNIGSVIKAGAVSAAVISAVMGSRDIEKAARQLVDAIRGQKHE